MALFFCTWVFGSDFAFVLERGFLWDDFISVFPKLGGGD